MDDYSQIDFKWAIWFCTFSQKKIQIEWFFVTKNWALFVSNQFSSIFLKKFLFSIEKWDSFVFGKKETDLIDLLRKKANSNNENLLTIAFVYLYFFVYYAIFYTSCFRETQKKCVQSILSPNYICIHEPKSFVKFSIHVIPKSKEKTR